MIGYTRETCIERHLLEIEVWGNTTHCPNFAFCGYCIEHDGCIDDIKQK